MLFQNLHTSPKPALNSNLKHESRITLNLLRDWGYLVGCFLVWFYHQIWIWPTASKDKNAAAQSLWVVVFSFTIALVSWFTLSAFRDSCGKPPPFPWTSQDLSVFNCLGLWKYMKQFPYSNRLRHPSLPLITCLRYWADWFICQYYLISCTCDKNKKLCKKNNIQPVCGLYRVLSHNKLISIPWLPWGRCDQLKKKERIPDYFLLLCVTA